MARWWVPLLTDDAGPIVEHDDRVRKGPLQGVILGALQAADPIKLLTYASLVFALLHTFYLEPNWKAAAESERARLAAVSERVALAGRLLEANASLDAALAYLLDAANAGGDGNPYKRIAASWFEIFMPIHEILARLPEVSTFSWNGQSVIKVGNTFKRYVRSELLQAFHDSARQYIFLVDADKAISILKTSPYSYELSMTIKEHFQTDTLRLFQKGSRFTIGFGLIESNCRYDHAHLFVIDHFLNALYEFDDYNTIRLESVPSCAASAIVLPARSSQLSFDEATGFSVREGAYPKERKEAADDNVLRPFQIICIDAEIPSLMALSSPLPLKPEMLGHESGVPNSSAMHWEQEEGEWLIHPPQKTFNGAATIPLPRARPDTTRSPQFGTVRANHARPTGAEQNYIARQTVASPNDNDAQNRSYVKGMRESGKFTTFSFPMFRAERHFWQLTGRPERAQTEDGYYDTETRKRAAKYLERWRFDFFEDLPWMTGATPDGKDELAVYVIKKQPVVYAASVEENSRSPRSVGFCSYKPDGYADKCLTFTVGRDKSRIWVSQPARLAIIQDVGLSNSRSMHVVDLERMEELTPEGIPQVTIYSAAISDDRSRVSVISQSGELWIYEGTNFKLLQRLDLGFLWNAHSERSSHMMVGLDPLKAGDDGILSRIDPLKGTEIWRARPLDGERFSAIIVSEDHHTIQVLGSSGATRLLDAATGIPLSRPINVTVFCSDAKYAELINVSSASVGIQCGRTVAIRKAAKLSWQLQTKEPQLGDYMIFPGATLP